MIDSLKSLLPAYKPCGCLKPKYGGPQHSIQECRLNDAFRIYSDITCFVGHCTCASCDSPYTVYQYVFKNSHVFNDDAYEWMDHDTFNDSVFTVPETMNAEYDSWNGIKQMDVMENE